MILSPQTEHKPKEALACSLHSIAVNMLRGSFCHFGINRRFALVGIFATALLIAVSFTPVSAQSDPYNKIDSVIVGSASSYPGGKFSVPVTVVNDEAIAGFSIPLNYPAESLTFDSASFAGSSARAWGFHGVTHDAGNATLLVGGVALGEPPINVGRNELAKLYFTVRNDVDADASVTLDSGFVAPAGRLELSAFDAKTIRPYFKPGTITIIAANRAPEFEPLSARTISEGEVLTFSVRAVDPERAAVKLHAGRLAAGARFSDLGNGTGTFRWQVPYVGTGSASGSPYVVTIFASDGEAGSHIDIPITVINSNRPPVITLGSSIAAGAGDTLFIPFVAQDPDFETVSFSAQGIPAGAQIGSTNPGFLRWVSDISDSGDYAFALTATDEGGASATENVEFTLLPTLPVELAISDEQAYSGEVVTISINLHNRVPITGFNLTIGFDPTLLTFVSADKSGTRIAGWPQLTQSEGTDKIFISARSTAGAPGNALAVGNGTVVKLRFQISSNLQFAGLYSPLEFDYVDPGGEDENIALDAAGAAVARSQTLYSPGGVLVKKYAGLVGDINLNGVAFEIGDVVYFTNFFINPAQYPLTGERLQNSDINQDGVPATLGDLIRLLLIVNGGAKLATPAVVEEFEYDLSAAESGLEYQLTQPTTAAAARLEFELSSAADCDVVLGASAHDFELQSHRDGTRLRVLLLGVRGRVPELPAGALVTISEPRALLVNHEFVDASGTTLTPIRRSTTVLPDSYELNQNYPNPFNPETVIDFALPQAGAVNLTVFNLLGETVTTLLDGPLPAGTHRVVFRGQDASGRGLPSGVYFYRLTAGAFSETKKMVLLK